MAMTSTLSLPAQIEAVRAAIARREQQTEDWSATESEIPKLMAVLVTLQQHERLGAEFEERKTHLHEVIGFLDAATRRVERLDAALREIVWRADSGDWGLPTSFANCARSALNADKDILRDEHDAAVQQHERLEAEYAHLSETAGEDYERGVQSGMKLSADHIERLEAVAKAARKLMDERKAVSATLFLNMAALTEAIAALDTAAPDKPEDAERGLRRDG